MKTNLTTAWMRMCCAWAIVTLLAFAPRAFAGDPKVTTIEAESCKGAGGKVFRDGRASGKKCVVVRYDTTESRRMLEYKGALPPGDYVLTAWIDAAPIATLHAMAAKIDVNGVTRTLRQIDFDGSESPGYQPFMMRFTHPGGSVAIAIDTHCGETPDGLQHDNTAEEKRENRKEVPIEAGGLDDKPAKPTPRGRNNSGDEFDIEEDPTIEKLTHLDRRIACDRLEIAALRTPPAIVAMVDVDKVHYVPGETVKGTAKLRGGDANGEYRLVAFDVTEADDRREVFAKPVTIPAKQAVEVTFEYSLAGAPEFGHELRCVLMNGDAEVHSNAEYFGMSKTVYRVAITGHDVVGQDKVKADREAIRAGMLKNKKSYANHFEQFSWAPCTFSNMTPKTEEWYSGQTQYHNSIAGIKMMIEEAHRVGIKVLTYGHAGAGGIAAFENYLRHPEIFATGYDGFGLYNTYLLERAYNNEYEFPDVPGAVRWRLWAAVWSGSGREATDWGTEQIIQSARMFGWDGVRWDEHLTPDPYVKERIRKELPNFIFGYNSVLASPDREVFIPPPKRIDDFHSCASGHGMMMDESVRGYSGDIRVYYRALSNEADYVKRIGGLPLIITFDTCSPQDGATDVLLALACGERYTYGNSPGDFAYGPMPRFLTRYSAFVWDDTARVADAARLASVNVGRGPKGATPWHEYTTWLRKLPNGRQQLLVNLVNPPGYTTFKQRVQTPPSTLYDVSVSVPTPAGAKLVRAMHVSPDITEGLVPLTTSDDAGGVKVTLPRLRNWSIVAFEYAPGGGTSGGGSGGGELAYPAFKITTPLEDAKAYIEKKSKEKLDKEQSAVRTEAGLEEAKPEKRDDHYSQDFSKKFNIDEEAAKKLLRSQDASVLRDGALDVLHCNGIFAWMTPVESAMGLAGGGNYDPVWVSFGSWRNHADGATENFPETLDKLLRYDVVVLDNMHAKTLGPRKRAMLAEYVRCGGGIVFFAGVDTFSMGADRNTAIDEILPVEIVSRANLVRNDKGMPLTPAKDEFFSPKMRWSQSPQVYCFDASPVKPGVEVIAKAGDKPVILAQNVGKGRVVAVMMNAIGNYADGSLPYWKWSDWPRAVASCLTYAAGDYKKTIAPTRGKRVLNPKEVAPDTLAIESAMLEAKEITKRLRSAQKNMIDAATSRTVLAVALDNADKIDDGALLPAIAETAGPYLDESFAPLAKKLLQSQLSPLRRAGYRVLGLAGDKSQRARLESALFDDAEPVNQREALLAIARLRTPESAPALRRYAAKNPDTFLTWGVLKRVGDPRAIADSTDKYAYNTRKLMAMTCGYWGQSETLSRIGYRLPPAAARKAWGMLDATIQTMRETEHDLKYYVASLEPLSDAEVAAIADFLSKTESRTLAPLAYNLCGRLPEDRAAAFRKRFANAKLAELRMLASD